MEGRQLYGDTQFCFWKGKETRDAIGVMRMLCEKSLKLDNMIIMCIYSLLNMKNILIG